MYSTVIDEMRPHKHQITSKITCKRNQTNRTRRCWASVNRRNYDEFAVDIRNAGENNTNHHYVEGNANPNLVCNLSSINKKMESILLNKLTDLKLKGTSDGN